MRNIKSYEIFKEDYNFIIEGIDYDYINKIVTVNKKHNIGIDTRININPTYYKIDNIDVISIFKRNKTNDKYDGNPLIYALKGIRGWKISKEDIILLLKDFIKISNKIESKYDTIVYIPSSNVLNNKFLYRLNKIIHCDNVISDKLFIKMEMVDIIDNVEFNKMEKPDAINLKKILDNMGDFFSFKEIPLRYRVHIKNIWKQNMLLNQLDIAPMINGKNILLLDDTVTSGSTISTFCKTFMDTYEPNNLTIVTLFSKL
jgi:hypothetical protein